MSSPIADLNVGYRVITSRVSGIVLHSSPIETEVAFGHSKIRESQTDETQTAMKRFAFTLSSGTFCNVKFA